MRKIFIILLLVNISSLFGQSNDLVFKRKLSPYNIYVNHDSISKANPKFDFKNTIVINNTLEIYNRNLGSINTFLPINDTFILMKSFKNINSNSFIVQDAFNPYGTNSTGLGLVMGAVGAVFTKSFTFKKKSKLQ
jgi:hypothetical protein